MFGHKSKVTEGWTVSCNVSGVVDFIRTCSTHGRDEKCRLLSEKPEEETALGGGGGVETVGKMILKLIFYE
jgi:hypothetical protein